MKKSVTTTIVQQLIAHAAQAGGDSLDIEYKDRHEEVCAMRGPIGFGIARFPSSSKEAVALLQALYQMAKRRTTVTVDEIDYDVSVRIYDSFDEDAFRVQFKQAATGPHKSATRDRGHRRARSKHAASRIGRGG